MLGLAIDPKRVCPLTINDLALDATGSPYFVSDADAVGQHVRQRLMFFKREWFLDLDAGIDHFAFTLGIRPERAPIAEAALKAEIIATPGVVEILEWDSEYDRSSRGLKVTRCIITTIYGQSTIF
jgi:hypothetical protein